MARKSRQIGPTVQHQMKRIVRNTFAIARKEECWLCIAAVPEIGAQCLARLLAEEYAARLSSLSIPDSDASRVQIQVFQFNVAQLLSSQPRV